MAVDRTSWLGKLRGHVGEARARFEADRREREAAGRLPPDQNIILSEKDVRGEWDASRVLYTTLGGGVRPLTVGDLAAFRQNMRIAKRALGSRFGKGITPRKVIDLASSRPLLYENDADVKRGMLSDIDKARREITTAIPASAVNDTVRMITNAGPTSKVTRHNVTIKMFAWNEACARLASTPTNDKAAARKIASWLRKQGVAFDCDCERHRYFFRYVATIGGFNAGRAETGYPKIRNPDLTGVACKHVLRALTEFESSGNVLLFLQKHLEKVNEYRATTQMKQKDAEEILKGKKRSTQIKTTDERRAAAAKARERRALSKMAVTPKKDPKKKARESRQNRQTEKALELLAKQYGMTVDQVKALLAGAAKKD